MSNRINDMHAEQELAAYLDKNLYPRIENSRWKRNNERQKQLRGIDGYLTIGKEEYVIDEKASLYYINHNLPTFSFEINSIQNGALVDGWLYATYYATTHYMLIYPNARPTNFSQPNPANVKSTDYCDTTCILISRQKIIGFLEEKGFSKERIEHDAEEIRNAKAYGRRPLEGVADFHYFLTDPYRFSEAPFNIIIRRSLLEELSDRIFTCS